MERLLISQLLKWKDSHGRKPLIQEGARQVGKTYILKEFGKNNYDNVLNNPESFNIEEHEKKFSKENYQKLKELVKEYIKYLNGNISEISYPKIKKLLNN